MKNKIAIYVICKNEESNIERFMSTAKEADYVVVLDTGSTDNTVEKLRQLGATVYQKEIKPWRFDVARNEALKLVPQDANICVSLDLDECFQEGWADILRAKWTNEMGMLRYYYVASYDTNNQPSMVFYRDKIHLNDYEKYHWIYRVHEVLTRPPGQKIYITDEIQCYHKQNTSTDRSNYLELLEQEYQENPDMRILHLLGREYFRYERYKECIEMLERMQVLAGGEYPFEQQNAYEYIGKSWLLLEDEEQAIIAFKKGFKIAPQFRGNILNAAMVYLQQGRLYDALSAVSVALQITEKPVIWADDPDAWAEKPYYIAGQVFYLMNKLEELQEMVKIIEIINPNFEQLPHLKTKLQNLTKH